MSAQAASEPSEHGDGVRQAQKQAKKLLQPEQQSSNTTTAPVITENVLLLWCLCCSSVGMLPLQERSLLNDTAAILAGT